MKYSIDLEHPGDVRSGVCNRIQSYNPNFAPPLGFNVETAQTKRGQKKEG